MTPYSIAHGREQEHAAELRAGLAQMVMGFSAYICEMCNGEGRRSETFTEGCGGGYFRSMTGCDYCSGTGLCQGSGLYNPAPASVREQVLTAGRATIASVESDPLYQAFLADDIIRRE